MDSGPRSHAATDPRARYTRGLAGLLATEEGTRALALLQKLRSVVDVGEPGFRLPRPSPHSVGIWRRDGTDLRRDENRREEWQWWCDTERIAVATGGPRVVLLGESAARGYFYDPWLTAASVLDRTLGTVSGLAGPQVVDLARTNAGATDVLRTALEATMLRPDVLVVFAGNNWHNMDLTPHQLQRVADAVAEDGFAGGQRVFTDLLVRYSAQVLDSLAALRDVLDVPLVLVVPEFNLADWRDEVAELCPALAGDGNRRWASLRRAAEQALADGRTATAMRLGRELVELDGGTSPVGQHIMAEVQRGCGKYEEARDSLRLARDAVGGVFVPHSPRCFGVVQDLMRAKAEEHDFGLVDLPELFARHGGPLPGRRFFLDYCHLSREGIELAMGAVAGVIAERLGAQAPTPVSEPAGPADAVAHFLAAVHNAHYGQADDVLLYHLRAAVAADAAVAAQLESYLDYQTRRAPHWMCGSFMRASANRSISRYLHAADSRLTGKLADHRLRAAMLTVLAEHGRDVATAWQRLLVAEHAAPRVDLLGDAYRAETFRQRSGYGLGAAKAFTQAYEHVLGSTLVLAAPAPVQLALTARLPGTVVPDGGELAVLVNGVPIREIRVGKYWRTERIPVPAARTRAGVNRVELRWPSLATDGQAQLAAAVAALERGELPASLPVLGQVHEFIAEVGRS